MTQFYACELSNTLNDCREVLILDIHGQQALLIEGNLGILGQWLGRFRRHRGSTPRCCRRWYATPGRTWRFALGIGASQQTEAEKEAEDTSPADERLFRANHTTFLRWLDTLICPQLPANAGTTGCDGVRVTVIASRPAGH